MSQPCNARRALRIMVLAASLALLQTARAADLLIPWPPGGETDKLIRPIAPFLARHLGKPVAPVNLPGGFGITGLEAAAKGAADGSSFVALHDYAFSVLASGKTNEDPTRDLSAVCGIVEVPSILATNRKALAGRSPEAFLKSRRAFSAAWTIGPTSTNFMMLALVEKAARVRLEFKGYRSKEAAISALNDGEVDLAEVGPIEAGSQGSENIVMLGVASTQRDAGLPQLPTLKELGLDVDYRIVRGLAVPKATPATTQAELERACRAAAADPALDAELARLGARARFTGATDLASLFAARRRLYGSGLGPQR